MEAGSTNAEFSPEEDPVEAALDAEAGNDPQTEQELSDNSEYSSLSDLDSDSAPEWGTETDSDDEELSSVSPTTTTEAWSDNPKTANVCPYILEPGLKENCEAKTPVDFLNLLFRKSLFENLVTNVNKQGRKKLTEKSINQWTDVSFNEIRVFVGLVFNMGTINTTVAEDFWRTNRGIYTPGNYMSEERFSIILKCLSFKDVMEKKGRMYNVSFIVDYFNNIMKQVVTPEKMLCIDESIGPFYERLYLLADQHGLVHKLLVYERLDDEDIMKFRNIQSVEVVKRLLEDKLNIGHSIYMDYDYNSIELAKFLIAHNTHVTGKLRRKRKGNPSEVIERELNVGEKVSKYNPDGICVMKWTEYVKEDVIMISSEHTDDWREHIKKHQAPSQKPACVLEYKKYRDGVKTHDESMSCYYYVPDELVWHKKVGIHILQMLLLNAHNMYVRYGEKPPLKKLLQFRTAVIGHLLSGADLGSSN